MGFFTSYSKNINDTVLEIRPEISNRKSGLFYSAGNNNTETKGKTSVESIRTSFDWRGKTILVAEDEETNYMYLKAALSRTNVNILRARNGEEAVEAVKSDSNIKVILMDIKMPKMDGLEATRIIKTFKKDIVVIAQTAFALDDDQYIYMEAGCADFLAKPITLDRLINTLSKYLG